MQIKHERKLMNRLLVAFTTKPGIDLPKYFGMYEFFVVPLSLLTPDGSFITQKIKPRLQQSFVIFNTKMKVKEKNKIAVQISGKLVELMKWLS